MKEILNNSQVRPGNATQFMHFVFSSDEEMMNFYLTLNRFINPESYLVESTDRKRLEDLVDILCHNVEAFYAIRHYQHISVSEVIKGCGVHMMNTAVSNTHRMQCADAVGILMNCVVNTTKNSWQFKKMDRINSIHIENVKYLLDRLT